MNSGEGNGTRTKNLRIRQVLVAVAAILTYGMFAGICANNGLLCSEISLSTGLEYGDVSLAFSIMNLVLAFSVPVFALLTLRIRCSYILMFGALMCSIGFFGTMMVTTVAGLIAFIGIIFGLGAASLSFTIVFTAAKPFFGEKGSAILSGAILASQGGIGFVLSSIIGGVTSTLGISACLGLISILALCFFIVPVVFIQRKRKLKILEPEPVREPRPKTGAIFRRLFTHPFFYLLFFGVLAFAMADGMLVNHSSQLLYGMFDLEEDKLSIITNIYTIGIMTGALTGGIISARVKNRPLALSIVFFSWVVVNGILSALNMYYMCTGTGTSILNPILFFLCGFLVHNCFVQIVGIASEHLSVAVSAVVIGLLDSFAYLIYSLNSLLGGGLYQLFDDFEIIYITTFVIVLLAGITFFIYALKHRNTSPEQYI